MKSQIQDQITIKEDKIYYNSIKVMDGFRIETPTDSHTNSSIDTIIKENTITAYIKPKRQSDYWGLFTNISFDEMIQYHRYNASWTIPLKIHHPHQGKQDVNFSFWKYQDFYGCMIPLCGLGFRATIGQSNGEIGVKSYSGVKGLEADCIPLFVVAFGTDPYPLFKKAYTVAATAMQIRHHASDQKKIPTVFEYLGWCSWNSSENGTLLNQEWLIESVSYFTEQIPLGWVLIDDGWMNHNNQALCSFIPSQKLFNDGFHRVVEEIQKMGVRQVGVWHTLNAYWKGIDKASPLGRQFESSLYQYGSNYFIRPEKELMDEFYDSWYSYLSSQGITFVKVDNQSCTQDLGNYTYPVFTLSQTLHTSINTQTSKHSLALLNCMDMTIDSIYNFGSSTTSRTSEDYFPNTKGYDLKHGNASAHIIQCGYNSIYMSQFIIPDFDMFETKNEFGELHAISRTISNGPIYITDRLGDCDFKLIKKVCFEDGRVVRSDTPLRPVPSCLFQLQETKVFKLYSMVELLDTALVLAGNFADCDWAEGKVSPSDIHEITANEFGIYEYFTETVRIVSHCDSIDVEFKRMEYELYYIIPIRYPCQPIGLVNKYNAISTITSISCSTNNIDITLYEGGTFAAILTTEIKNVKVNDRDIDYTISNSLLKVECSGSRSVIVSISW